MTQLQLIEVDPNPGGNELPETRTIKAVSSSYKALEDYCEKTFGRGTGKVSGTWELYYEVEDSEIVMVPCNQNRFD